VLSLMEWMKRACSRECLAETINFYFSKAYVEVKGNTIFCCSNQIREDIYNTELKNLELENYNERQITKTSESTFLHNKSW